MSVATVPGPRFKLTRDSPALRRIMVDEIARAIRAKQHYAGDYLNAEGKRRFPELLAEAARRHDEQWLVEALLEADLIAATAPRNAAQVIAEQHFIRFYMIAVSVQALSEGRAEVTLYRAKTRGQPRHESLALEGTSVPAQLVLEVLRNLKAAEAGCPFWKPNSGLAVE